MDDGSIVINTNRSWNYYLNQMMYQSFWIAAKNKYSWPKKNENCTKDHLLSLDLICIPMWPVRRPTTTDPSCRRRSPWTWTSCRPTCQSPRRTCPSWPGPPRPSPAQPSTPDLRLWSLGSWTTRGLMEVGRNIVRVTTCFACSECRISIQVVGICRCH